MDIYWSNGFFGHTEINVCKEGFKRETHVEGARGCLQSFGRGRDPRIVKCFIS